MRHRMPRSAKWSWDAPSASQLERAALDAAAAEQQLGQVHEDGVVTSLAQLGLEALGARGDDDVESVARGVEAEHGAVFVGHEDRVGVALGEHAPALLVEGAGQ